MDTASAILLLILSIGAAHAAEPFTTIEAETMTHEGCVGTIGSQDPFAGLRFYCNGDKATASIALPTVPGRYEVTVRGASTAASAAGIAVYLGLTRVAALSFGATPSEESSQFDMESAPSPSELRLVLETDDGSNDTDVDKVTVAYVGEIPAPPPPPVPPSVGAYESGTYRNLFAERGIAQGAIDTKIDEAWQQLFHGDDSQERVYYPSGADEAYILDVGNNDVRSEGMSYGMMIAVQLDKRVEFDRLWRFAYRHMRHEPADKQGYFAWQVKTDGTVIDPGSAPDGEEYFAMALMFASHRWGDGSGILEYGRHADDILHAMLHQADDGQGTNMFDLTEKKVVFAPIGNAATFTDPSYHLPAFYELWARWAPRDTSLWRRAADTSRAFFARTTHATTGLGPDYAEFSGAPKHEGNHADFRFDAWRIAQNIAMDYAWWAADPWQTAFADRILAFFDSEGIDSYANQYRLDGTALSTDHSPGLVAMNAVAALASTKSYAWKFVDELWELSPPTGKWRYYDGMLYMLGLLHVSGKFRIWDGDTAMRNHGVGSPQQASPMPTMRVYIRTSPAAVSLDLLDCAGRRLGPGGKAGRDAATPVLRVPGR